MRKFLMAVGCCGLIFVAGWAFGQKTLNASGWNDLRKVDDLAQLMFVKGYAQGYSDGDRAMEKIATVLTKGNAPDSTTKTVVTPQMRHVKQMVGLGSNGDITFGRIVDATNSFYSDYRNAPVCWNDALQFSVWSLNGDAATEQEVEAARKRGAGTGCK